MPCFCDHCMYCYSVPNRINICMLYCFLQKMQPPVVRILFMFFHPQAKPYKNLFYHYVQSSTMLIKPVMMFEQPAVLKISRMIHKDGNKHSSQGKSPERFALLAWISGSDTVMLMLFILQFHWCSPFVGGGESENEVTCHYIQDISTQVCQSVCKVDGSTTLHPRVVK